MPSLRRALRPTVGAVAAAAVGVVASLAVLPAAPAAAAVTDLVINEVHSDASPDWFELANPTGSDIDLAGLWYTDNTPSDPTHWAPLTGTVPAGGVLAIDSDEPGLGKGDSVTVYTGDKAAFDGGSAAVLDSITWPAGTHATSMGLCPGSDELVAMTPTKGAANDCPPPGLNEIKVNEVFSDGTDFVELTNIGSSPVDVNGWTAVDADPTHTPIPIASEATVIEPGEHLSFEPDDDTVYGEDAFGLGKGDSVTIALPDGREVDSTTWPADTHAAPSWGRCPDGLGDFEMNLSATRGAANDCPSVPGATDVKINEVSSDPTDWIELTNTGDAGVDLSGWALADNGGVSNQTLIPSGTTLPAGGFLRIDFSGLGKGDSANLYLPDLLTVADTTTWPADTHAAPSWGRCPDGAGAFRMTVAATPNAANDCSEPPAPELDPNWDDVEINEISSLNDDDQGNPGFGDAVELVNTGSDPVTIQGWYQTDSGAATGATALQLADLMVWDGDSFEPAPSWTIPAGGYVAFSSTRGLSGEGDAVKVYGPGADAAERQLVDEQTYGDGDGGVSDNYESDSRAFAACPDGSDEFWRVTVNSFGQDNTASCETRSRRLDSPVVVNEISNVDGRVELLNTGDTAVDVSGWELVDSEGDVVHTVPAGTDLAPSAFYLATGITGLDSADSLTVRSAEGATRVEHTWYEDGIASYSRCELFGEISFVETPTATWGAANACPELDTEVWPGSPDIAIADAADAFTDADANDEGDVSGATFDPSDPSVLWVAMNKGRLFKMRAVDGIYEAFPEWEGGLPLRFADGGGELDSEGVAVGPDGSVYVTSERDNLRARNTSHNVIARYDVSGVTEETTELVAEDEWDVNTFVPTGTNLGLEGIAYVPDAFLADAGWTYAGGAYARSTYPTPGLFVTAVEGTGDLHFFSLADGAAPVEVKVERSGFPFAMDVAFDADRERLWTLCDDSCGGVYNLLDVVGGDLEVEHSYARPAGMPNLNNEGMAIAPRSTCVAGFQEVVWTDDGDTDGFSLRRGTLPCPAAPDPDPDPDPDPEPVAPTVSGGDASMVYGRSTTMRVTVAADGVTPGGTVTLTSGGLTLGTGTLAGGTADVQVPARLLEPRATSYPVTIAYAGDDEVAAGTGSARLTVSKGAVELRPTVRPDRVVQGRTRPRVVVAVGNADGVPVAGTVTVSGHGKTFAADVVDGRARIRLDAFRNPGRKKLTVTYAGSDLLESRSETVRFRVLRKR